MDVEISERKEVIQFEILMASVRLKGQNLPNTPFL
jgi:hypothetical protein